LLKQTKKLRFFCAAFLLTKEVCCDKLNCTNGLSRQTVSGGRLAAESRRSEALLPRDFPQSGKSSRPPKQRIRQIQGKAEEGEHIMEEYKLFDAEYKFLSVIWEREPINSTELSKVCLEKLGWKKSTTFNMIRKLAERGYIKNENATVTATVKKEQVAKYESESVVEKNFGGSLPAFIAAFLDGKKITAEEAAAVKKMIEEAEKEEQDD